MRGKIILGLVLVVFLGLFATIAIPNALTANDVYIGELAFNTEQEYMEFKQEIIDSNAKWDKMEILSSSPPIIVHFGIRVSQDYDFPFGEKRSRVANHLLAYSMMLIMFSVIAYGIFKITQDN